MRALTPKHTPISLFPSRLPPNVIAQWLSGPDRPCKCDRIPISLCFLRLPSAVVCSSTRSILLLVRLLVVAAALPTFSIPPLNPPLPNRSRSVPPIRPFPLLLLRPRAHLRAGCYPRLRRLPITILRRLLLLRITRKLPVSSSASTLPPLLLQLTSYANPPIR